MSGFAITLLIIGLGLIAWLSARARAIRLARAGHGEVPHDRAPEREKSARDKAARRPLLHSLPSYHGWYAAIWVLVPSLLFLTVWTSIMPGLVTERVLARRKDAAGR